MRPSALVASRTGPRDAAGGPSGETHRRFRIAPVLMGSCCLGLAGCVQGGASAYTIAGAHFPASLLCAGAGLLVTALFRIILVGVGLEAVMPARLLVYAACAASVGVWSWLILFGEP